MLPDIQGFGLNIYEYERGDGRRFQVSAARTVMPDEGESNEAFAQRIEGHVRAALQDPAIVRARIIEEIAAYSVVQYTIMVEAAPRLAPIKRDLRLAGTHRRMLPRGIRGGERHKPVLH